MRLSVPQPPVVRKAGLIGVIDVVIQMGECGIYPSIAEAGLISLGWEVDVVAQVDKLQSLTAERNRRFCPVSV